MDKLTVTIKSHVYDVHIGEESYDLFATQYADLLNSTDKIAIIADEAVAERHLPLLQQALEPLKKEIAIKMVPAGETCKTLAVYFDCQSFLLKNGFTRNSLVIAFGGGACGDLTGFVSATFMRGIRYIHCPTTILAHDSAVGGKTAINMPEGKNMVGAFHQPSAVLFNTNVFKSLPAREFRSGMAELLKHAFISDEKWTKELMDGVSFSNPSISWLSEELLRGIKVKAAIVEEDEFEHGKRKFLNFGHTFGHAVEAASGYGKLSHGECIMIGMAYSLILSENNEEVDSTVTNEFIKFAHLNGYRFNAVHEFSFETFISYMHKDKKASFGKLNFVLLEKIGAPYVTEVTSEQCEAAYLELKQRTEEMI